ncbi:MAG: pyridoxamine 5'-phosphate oxidase family protein [Spirochaetales bacterium]|nr:pyridoxamine 5'-phosphate oxidase family protein [Spirochaetales bacterium]
MRRNEREITDRVRLAEMFSKGTVCHLALNDGNAPYVVPMSYGYENWELYFHCADEGKKLELLNTCPEAGFCISRELELVTGDSPCSWGVRYESIIGRGTVRFIQDQEEKRHALDILMAHYGWSGPADYSSGSFAAATVFALDIKEATGKASPVS